VIWTESRAIDFPAVGQLLEYPFISAVLALDSRVLFLILCFHHHLINQSATALLPLPGQVPVYTCTPITDDDRPENSFQADWKWFQCYIDSRHYTYCRLLFYSYINKKMILPMAFILSSDALMASDIRATWCRTYLVVFFANTLGAEPTAHNDISRSNCWIIPLKMADQQRWNCHTATPHDPADYHQKWPIGVRRKHILFIFRLFDNRIPSTTIPFRQIQQQWRSHLFKFHFFFFLFFSYFPSAEVKMSY
jgi:hypothetical protein